MYRQQLRQQCLCIHCIEPGWGPEWSSELYKYRAQPSRRIQAKQSANNTDTSIPLTNSITNTNTPVETSKQSPALRGQMIWHAADRRGGESQLHSHRLHKHDMVALCRGMYRYNSNKAVKDTTTRTLKPTNSNKETEATSHSAINSDTDKQIIRKRQLVLTAMITTQGRGSWRRIGFIAQPLLLNHRKLRIQQLIQQCLCRHCSETDWGPERSSELLKYRAQPSRRMQATQSACHSTDTSIHLTNSITNTNTNPAETSKQSPALRGQMIRHAADRRGGDCQRHSHRLHKHDMIAFCRDMYRYRTNSNKAPATKDTSTLKSTNSNKETEATSHPAINSDTDIQIIWKRQLALTVMITTRGRGSMRRIGFIAQPLLLNHRNLPTRLGNSAFTSDKLFVRTGLRLGIYGDSTKARRRRVKDNISCHKEVRTYTRGGARHNKMAKACRRFTAGERATASHERTELRGESRKTVRCVEGLTSRTNRQGKTKGRQIIKYLRAIRLLVAPTTSEGNGVGGGGRVAVCKGASIPILNKGGTQCGCRNPRARAQKET